MKNLIDEYMELTKDSEMPSIYCKWTAISIISALLQGNVWVKFAGMTIYPNLYICLVGRSGCRKTTSASFGMSMIQDFKQMKHHMTPEVTTPAAMLTALSEMTVMGMDGKPTMTPCYAFLPELSVFMDDTSGGGSMIPTLTRAFDFGAGDRKRALTKRTKGEGAFAIEKPILSVLSCTTPEWITKGLPYEAIGGGLTSRFIYVFFMGDVEKQDPFNYDLTKDVWREELIVKLRNYVAPMRGEFKLTDEAKKFYTNWYMSDKEDLEQQFLNYRFAGYKDRRNVIVIKLAMTFAAARMKDGLIEKRDIERSIEELKLMEEFLPLAFGSKGRSQVGYAIALVWEQLVHFYGKTITVGELYKTGLWRDVEPDKMNQVLIALTQMGFLKMEYDTNLGEKTLTPKTDNPLI